MRIRANSQTALNLRTKTHVYLLTYAGRQTPPRIIGFAGFTGLGDLGKQLTVPTRFDRRLCYFLWAGPCFRVMNRMGFRHPAKVGRNSRSPDERDQTGGNGEQT